jgi:hypothetical protein
VSADSEGATSYTTPPIHAIADVNVGTVLEGNRAVSMLFQERGTQQSDSEHPLVLALCQAAQDGDIATADFLLTKGSTLTTRLTWGSQDSIWQQKVAMQTLYDSF